MRHLMLLVAVVVLCALGPPSWAYYNPFAGYGGQPVSMKLVNCDVGTQYFKLDLGKNYSQTELDALPIKTSYDPNASGPYKILPVGSPIPTGGSTASIEDSWGIVKVSEIVWGTTTSGPQIWNAATSGWEITGIFYNEKDAEVRQSGPGGTSNNVFGNDLYAVFFAEPLTESFGGWTGDGTPGNPPNARAYEQGVSLGASSRGTDVSGNPLPEMQGCTESQNSTSWMKNDPNDPNYVAPTPLWTFETVVGDPFAYSVPPSLGGQGTGAQYEYYSTYSTNANGTMISGTGGAWAATHTDPYWGAGVANEMWQYNPSNLDPPHAVKLSFTMMPPVNSGWLISSNDPISGAITPELSSASLMLVGLFPLGLLAWKRRKQ